MKTFSAFRLVSATLVAATAVAASAEPQIPHFERNATVYVADLDLASERDARVLYERISYAARSICAADELSFDVKKRLHQRTCVETAVADAVDRANAPLLTAIHLQRREQLARL